MDLMPTEILTHILQLLSGSDRLRASFTCRRWLALMSSCLPQSIQVCVNLDASSCNAFLSHSLDAETTVAICSCESHARTHAVLLSCLFECVSNDIRSLVIDDDLVARDGIMDKITDEVLHSVLLEAPVTIQELILRNADLSLVRAWTFALLAKFSSLKEFSLIDCVLPKCESLMLRLLSPSYESLVSVTVTNSDKITDKFASVIARRCPLVSKVNFSGCTQITALTIVLFCEAAVCRTAEMLFVGLSGTNFSYSKATMKWDAVILTASDVAQKKAFELQLEMLSQLEDYVEKFFVFEDKPENVRIGSGGSTILTLNQLSQIYGKDFSSKKILIIHCGGMSQRLPIASALGKVFLLLPGGKTILEWKLISYRPILHAMPAGVMIGASDTLEYIPSNIGSILPGDVTLFAHPSNIEVAMQHGVYVMKDGCLQTVLQKPSLEELKASGALKPNKELAESELVCAEDELEGDEHALTDSFFVLSPATALHLASLKTHEPFDCETCCYGDFLRALGTLPQLNYLETKEPLGIWRQRFAAVFRGLSCRVVVLPQNSFFHFGTPTEVLANLRPDSVFARRFDIPNERTLHTFLASNSKIGQPSLLEWCRFPNGVSVGNKCLLSDLQSSKFVEIPEGTMLMSVAMKSDDNVPKFITAIFGVSDDLKIKKSVLKWFSRELSCNTPSSLWFAKLFKVCSSVEESLNASLFAMTKDSCDDELISLSEALQRKDVEEMVRLRKMCKS